MLLAHGITIKASRGRGLRLTIHMGSGAPGLALKKLEPRRAERNDTGIDGVGKNRNARLQAVAVALLGIAVCACVCMCVCMCVCALCRRVHSPFYPTSSDHHAIGHEFLECPGVK